jgi:DNA-binding transcriptional ArsR family regulator
MDAFAALAVTTRRDIVKLVARRGEMTSTDISQSFSVSAPAISQHLKVLREAKVLQMKKDGQRRLYSLNESAFDDIDDWLTSVKTLWNKRLDNLDRYLQKLKKERLRDQKK